MKLIVPMAEKRDSVKSSANNTPKALIHLAGKPLIEHILDSISSLKFEKAIFIVDQRYPELENLIEKKYSFKPVFIMQKEIKGVGHAILGAKNHVGDDDTFIVFADTVVETDFKIIKKLKHDGIIWTEDVLDPRKLGVAFLHDGLISKLIEKPDTPVSDKALVGMYYFRKADSLFNALEFLIANDIKTKGEYQLTDAIQIMIDKGSKIVNQDVEVWKDCGGMHNLLEANKYLLGKTGTKTNGEKNTIIINPVFIEKGAEVVNSVIGPNVSIGSNALVRNSIISNSILNKDSSVTETILKDCIIGKHTKVHGSSRNLNLEDSSEFYYS